MLCQRVFVFVGDRLAFFPSPRGETVVDSSQTSSRACSPKILHRVRADPSIDDSVVTPIALGSIRRVSDYTPPRVRRIGPNAAEGHGQADHQG